MSMSLDEARSEVARERWMRDTGRCPDCGEDLGSGQHPEDACGEDPYEVPTCDLCRRAIPVMSELPLCRWCIATAKAHGRQETERRRQEAEGMGRRD
ncbi:MAG TPA: hypothetical protein VNA25_05980 [Phycisphaerae bacterium]|nr:hypothetical protein [Phycisphaerae bacterium]